MKNYRRKTVTFQVAKPEKGSSFLAKALKLHPEKTGNYVAELPKLPQFSKLNQQEKLTFLTELTNSPNYVLHLSEIRKLAFLQLTTLTFDTFLKDFTQTHFEHIV